MEPGGRRFGIDVQIPAQGFDALLILLERVRAPAGPLIEPNQGAMGVFP